ncbi:hypothetical protein ONZ45_g11711 [Pleurotus djamor]|nr:hypothetical protein ONZ45_g11711 [Pleurotus djamor]
MSYWLLKAEPDSRIVKRKDVKFSVDDFENIKTTPWEGVRNYEARNLMKEMKVGDKARSLLPFQLQVTRLASPPLQRSIPNPLDLLPPPLILVSREAYPDYTAWDASHPYYDAKTKQDNPKWYMVDLTFVERAKHFIPLSVLRYIADSVPTALDPEIEYIGEDGVEAIKNMDLITRGRLSVQRVTPESWAVIQVLAERGGFDDLVPPTPKPRGKGKRKAKKEGKKKVDDEVEEEGEKEEKEKEKEGDVDAGKKAVSSKKRTKDAIDEGAGDEKVGDEGEGVSLVPNDDNPPKKKRARTKSASDESSTTPRRSARSKK